MAIIAYDKNGFVYYDLGNRRGVLAASNATFVSVSGNFIVYRKNNHTYKAELNNNGYITISNILVA